jgi:hypothetical protein
MVDKIISDKVFLFSPVTIISPNAPLIIHSSTTDIVFVNDSVIKYNFSLPLAPTPISSPPENGDGDEIASYAVVNSAQVQFPYIETFALCKL